MSVEVRSNPGPESDEASLALFRFDDEGWLGLMRDAATPPADLGAVAGYRVLEEVGRGGQGVVFRAREESSGRIVALKRLAAGSLAGSEARARFRREIEAEAALRHPGIVGFQGVEVVDGQPLLVMEWIDGLPAARWARDATGRARPVREVLAAFARICDAVAYAHQRGVIHRDLKPSNILIDAAGEPHVLDFGLARLRPEGDAVGPEISRLTQTEGFVGTPAYAAPEHLTPGRAGGGGPDVRADVYALGVVLYEMMTGRRPFEPEGDLEQLLRSIREDDAPPPSRYERGVGDEVDAIVLRAMAKDPARRYQSVHELGADVRRYLAGEPVEARRDSAWYVARKTLRRHRVALLGGAVLAVTLVLGSVGTTVGMLRARAASARAARVTEYIQRMVGSADPHRTPRGTGYTVEQMLREVAASLGGELEGEPAVEVAIRLTIGRAYRTLGDLDEADEHLRVALVRAESLPDPEAIAEVMAAQAGVLHDRGRYAAAGARAGDALGIVSQRFGERSVQAAACLCLLADNMRHESRFQEAEATARRAVDILGALPEVDPGALGDARTCLALVLHDRGRHADAADILRTVLEADVARVGSLHPSTTVTMTNLALALQAAGELGEAERLLREALGAQRETLGDDHADVAATLNNLGALLEIRRDVEEAESLYGEALRIMRRSAGGAHPAIAQLLNNIGVLRRNRGDLAGAAAAHREALDMRRSLLGPDHPDVGTSLGRLGLVVEAGGDAAAAEQMFREALVIHRSRLPEDHPSVVTSVRNFGALVERQERWAEAEALYRESVDRTRGMTPVNEVELSAGLGSLARALLAQGRSVEAEAVARECLAIRERLLPDGHPEAWRRYNVMGLLGETLVRQGRYAEAESPLTRAYHGLRNDHRVPRGRRDYVRESIARVIELFEAWEAAEPGRGTSQLDIWQRTLADWDGRP